MKQTRESVDIAGFGKLKRLVKTVKYCALKGYSFIIRNRPTNTRKHLSIYCILLQTA